MERRENRWFPILAAVENPTGTWKMIDTLGSCYGLIRIMRRGDEVYYKAQTWAEHENGRRVLGHFRTLQQACNATHQALLARGVPGAPEYQYLHGEPTQKKAPSSNP
ncbi:hypothetical protein [Leifsonia sp. Root4]|uniref:hypothetical protein n=1 Tax=Leifsonia sp. Root4 TaxID=1736525 RepID=UPI000AA50997|nr:hypothetical protein [Leifsonia sp. Root4]